MLPHFKNASPTHGGGVGDTVDNTARQGQLVSIPGSFIQIRLIFRWVIIGDNFPVGHRLAVTDNCIGEFSKFRNLFGESNRKKEGKNKCFRYQYARSEAFLSS